MTWRPNILGRVIGIIALGGVMLSAQPVRAAAPENFEFFEKNIRPLFVEKCYSCHSIQGGKSKGGLLLDTKQHLLAGGENGSIITPGDPTRSRLIEAVRWTNKDLKMPPKERLTEQQVADLVVWVKSGAPDPRTAISDPLAGAYDYAAARKTWAWSHPTMPEIPAVKNSGWIKSPIDNFILSKLEAKGLNPAPAADKRTLIRRATYDLIGLPPTPEEVDAFLADRSPDAFAKVIDRLLASPEYGERWGRHWLDVVRYTDSFDARVVAKPGDVRAAWRYRDWVVNAFNSDLPYDQFIKNQIAGDLLPKKDPGDFSGLIATTMYVIGNWPGGDADRKKMITDMVDDQIDVTGRAFLGVTLGCARCHDHKFDPFPQADYYSLAGIFFSTHFMPGQGSPAAGGPLIEYPMMTPSESEKLKQQKDKIAQLVARVDLRKSEVVHQAGRQVIANADKYLAASIAMERPGAKVADIAAARGLDAKVLDRWSHYVASYRGITPMEPRTLLTRAVPNSNDIQGMIMWYRPDAQQCPCVTLNPIARELNYSTITLPPRCVAVHPGPASGVGISWKSPITGIFQIHGRVSDADAHGGDGIAWRITRGIGVQGRDLAGGGFPNGGAQTFAAVDVGSQLESVSVQAGQVIQLGVYPKAEYTCDSTVVELEITEKDGAHRTWNVTKDLLAATGPAQMANPHADSLGNADVWSFADIPNLVGDPTSTNAALLMKWSRSVDDEMNRAEPPELALPPSTQPAIQPTAADMAARDALLALDQKVTNAAGNPQELTQIFGTPDGRLYRDLTEDNGAFWPKAPEATEFGPQFAAEIKGLRDEAAKIQAEMDKNPPAFCNGMSEGGIPDSIYAGIHDAHIHVRGRYDRQTTLVPRRFPRLLAGDNQKPLTQGSGRLQLADWVASADNPMTAKVMANRIWQHHFGEGIVRTPNNYGKLGVPPTHPELLNYLAVQFVKSGWSIKAMHRQIMLSAAYQQSSEPDPETYKADPDNLLWGHVNRQRLEAESIRDTLLADAGNLDRTVGGPEFSPLGNHRRTIYLQTIRSDRADYRSLFDAADASAIADRRIDSTVAPQALFLMNNPFVLAQSKALAARVMKDGPADDAGKIAWLYRHLFNRDPKAEETQVGLALLDRSLNEVKDVATTQPADPAQVSTWTEYCQVLFCSNELVYID